MVNRLRKRLTATLAFGISLIMVIISFFVVFTFYRQNKTAIYENMHRIFKDIDEETVNRAIPDTLETGENGEPLELDTGLDFGMNSAVFILKEAVDDDHGESPGENGDAGKNNSLGSYINSYFVLSNRANDKKNMDDLVAAVMDFDENTKDQGLIKNTYYAKKDYRKGTLVLLDSDETFVSKVKVLVSTTVAILIVGVLFSFWVARMLAEWLTRPVRESLESQSSFISDVSHELKTPLAVITANADAIEAESGESKWLSSIKNESLRMGRLITELLAASKLEHQDSIQTFEKIDFSSIVNESVITFDALAFEKGVLIESDIQDNVYVTGSEEKLHRLMGILLDNAVKYVNKGGVINVKLHLRLGSVILTVRNTGSYVDKENRKRIFDRFYRVDESRARDESFGSYGLGLSIARSIVEEHSGDIVCQSTRGNPDVTVFKVTF